MVTASKSGALFVLLLMTAVVMMASSPTPAAAAQTSRVSLAPTDAQSAGSEQSEDQLEFFGPERDLRGYVEEALENHPGVQEALARYRASLERVPQVSALPDPMFSFGHALRRIETRVGPQLNSYVLSQAFPWFGTLDLRGKVALQEAAARYQLYRAAQREVVVQVKKAYYDLGYVQAALEIAREEQSLLEHYETLAQTRYATGQGLQQGVIKIQAEITRILNRLDVLEQQGVSLVARLNTLRDRPPHESLGPVESPTLPEVSPDLDELYRLGEENREELQAASKLIARSERSIELAKKDFWPDFTVGAGFINVGDRADPAGLAQPPPDNGKNAFSLSVGINIPLWRDKYQAAVREASEQLLAERSNYARILNDVEFAVRDRVIRLETLRDQVRLFESVLIPQAEEALRSSEAAYETGQLGVLDLLDSERVLLEVRLTNRRFYADYLIALADLERALGTRYPR